MNYKTQKLKRYRLSVSRTFPKGHSKAGQETGFVQKIIDTQMQFQLEIIPDFKIITGWDNLKLHTIRGNYLLWEKRVKEVNDGKAIIEVFYWSKSPYNYLRDGSKQVVFTVLDKNSGCGVQECIYETNFEEPFSGMAIRRNNGIFRDVPFYKVAENDGLQLSDFIEWFETGKYDLTKSMAIIHWTDLRY